MNTIATQSSPYAALSPASSGIAKWNTTSVESTKRSIAGSVSRPRSSTRRSLRVSASDVGDVRHASASLELWSAATRSGLVRRDDDRLLPREGLELVVEKRRAVLVERGVGLVEHEQVGRVEERATEREPLRHAS